MVPCPAELTPADADAPATLAPRIPAPAVRHPRPTRCAPGGCGSRARVTRGRIVNQVRTLRFLNGDMREADLGQAIGVTRQTIAAIEASNYSPTLEATFRIAQVFGKPEPYP